MKVWEVFDAHGDRLVARLERTESALLDCFDRFTESGFMIVMAAGWTEGTTMKDGSVLHAINSDRVLCFKVVPAISEGSLTRKKRVMFPCETVRWCRERNEWVNHESHPGYLEACRALVAVAASMPEEDFQLLY